MHRLNKLFMISFVIIGLLSNKVQAQIEVIIKGMDDGVKTSKQHDYEEAVINAKIQAIERAGVEISSVTKIVNFKAKYDAVETKAKAVLLPGFQITDMGYMADGTYQIVLVGKVSKDASGGGMAYILRVPRWQGLWQGAGKIYIGPSSIDGFPLDNNNFCIIYLNIDWNNSFIENNIIISWLNDNSKIALDKIYKYSYKNSGRGSEGEREIGPFSLPFTNKNPYDYNEISYNTSFSNLFLLVIQVEGQGPDDFPINFGSNYNDELPEWARKMTMEAVEISSGDHEIGGFKYHFSADSIFYLDNQLFNNTYFCIVYNRYQERNQSNKTNKIISNEKMGHCFKANISYPELEKIIVKKLQEPQIQASRVGKQCKK